MRMRAALIASLLAVATQAAGGNEDWAAVIGGAAEAQLQKRLDADVRTIPGTDTRYLIGGFAQVDGLATRRQQTGDAQGTFLVSATPFGPADSDQRLSVRQSQINWLSYTPTAVGTMTTRVQANLFPVDLEGTSTLTLQQLFAGIANGLVAGKTFSTFVDADVLPTTLDYNGPSGETSVSQWLARGSISLGQGLTLAAAVEDARAHSSAGDGVLAIGTNARGPDLAARLRYDFDSGHVQISGLSRRLAVTATTALRTLRQTVDGSGVSLSVSLATVGDDSLAGQFATGKGIGRYFNDALSSTGVALDSDGRLDLVRSTGATLYYQRQWAPEWTTVAGASTLWAGNDGGRAADELRRVTYASANLIYRWTPTLHVGGEVLWGQATRVDGATATNTRLQLMLRYLVL